MIDRNPPPLDGWHTSGKRHYLDHYAGPWTISHFFLDGLSRYQLWHGQKRVGVYESVTQAKAAQDAYKENPPE